MRPLLPFTSVLAQRIESYQVIDAEQLGHAPSPLLRGLERSSCTSATAEPHGGLAVSLRMSKASVTNTSSKTSMSGCVDQGAYVID
jgi:hypothetical protein